MKGRKKKNTCLLEELASHKYVSTYVTYQTSYNISILKKKCHDLLTNMSAAETLGSNLDSTRADAEDVPDGAIVSAMTKMTQPRIVKLGDSSDTPRKKNENYIITAKYTILTFLPKFLYEQFRRYANIFFLAIGLFQQIDGISPTGKLVTIVPFSAILFVTALKVSKDSQHLKK